MWLPWRNLWTEMFLQRYHQQSHMFLCQWIWARWHQLYSSRWWVCYAYFTWSRFYSPPPPSPTGMYEHFKNENKLLRETIYQFIIIIFSYILIILWYNNLFFSLGTSTGKTYFWVAASQVLLQFRLDHVVNSTLRLTHSSPEAHYIRTVDFDHRKQLVCWVRNLFKIKSR